MQTLQPFINSHGTWKLRDSVSASTVESMAGLVVLVMQTYDSGADSDASARMMIDGCGNVFRLVLDEPEKFVGCLWLADCTDVGNETVRQAFKIIAHCGRELKIDLPDFDAMSRIVGAG